MILDYNARKEKRGLQRRIFPLIHKKKIVTLAGPNVLAYMHMLPRYIKKAEIWENDASIMIEQLRHIKEITGVKVKYKFGDIINAEIMKDTFYDLDFCCSTVGAKKHIRKFKDCAYSLTLALRPNGLIKVLEDFLECVQEKKLSDIPHPYYNLLKTNKNTYMYVVYMDVNPMVNIFKFHK